MKSEVWRLKSEVWGLSSYDNLKIKISTENALEYLAFGRGFYGDRLTGSKSKLESWTKSLTKMKSEVWSLKSDGVVFVILRKSLTTNH